MPVMYASGGEIRQGDRIIYDDLPGEVEVVADPAFPTTETDWYVDEFGGGILVAEPTVFGRVFVRLDDIAENVVFVGRKRV